MREKLIYLWDFEKITEVYRNIFGFYTGHSEKIDRASGFPDILWVIGEDAGVFCRRNRAHILSFVMLI